MEDSGSDLEEDLIMPPDTDEEENDQSEEQYDYEYSKALEKYERVVSMEADPAHAKMIASMREGPWSFQSMSKIVTIRLITGNMERLVDDFRKLLQVMRDTYVAANDREDAIGSILGHPSLDAGTLPKGTVDELYDATLATLKPSDRLWLKISLSRAHMCLRAADASFMPKIPGILKNLYDACRSGDGNFDKDKASDLLEVYAIEMQFLFKSKNFSRMKIVYPKTKGSDVTNAVEDSRTMGPLREYGGRMWMHFRKWTNAYDEFFDAFRAYEEVGKSTEAKCCIRYLVVANILSGGSVNPFAAREIVAHSQNDAVQAMKNLRDAFHNDEIVKFEAILRSRHSGIATDPVVGVFVEDLIRTMRIRVVMRLIDPYRRVRIDFVAKRLSTDLEVTRKLFEELILDGEISGTIDEIEGFYERNVPQKNAKALESMVTLSEKLDDIRKSFTSEMP
eukprot:g128.t1